MKEARTRSPRGIHEPCRISLTDSLRLCTAESGKLSAPTSLCTSSTGIIGNEGATRTGFLDGTQARSRVAHDDERSELASTEARPCDREWLGVLPRDRRGRRPSRLLQWRWYPRTPVATEQAPRGGFHGFPSRTVLKISPMRSS